MNHAQNTEAANITQANYSYLQKNGDAVLGHSYEEMKASGVTAKDVSETILGLREYIEANNAQGQDTSAMRAEVARLMQVRAQLASNQG